MKVGGIILCGGRSRRMRRPKAWLPFGDEVLLQRVVRLVGDVVAPLVVVAAPEQEAPPLPPGVAVIRDPVEGRGPLQGLAVGLAVLRGRADAAYLSGCDTPLLRPAFVRRMVDLLGDNAICVPHIDGYFHPLAAVYRLDVLAAVEQRLRAGRLRMAGLFDAVPTRRVAAAELAAADPDLLTLRNLNTPEDYEAALRLLPDHGGVRLPENTRGQDR